MKVIFLIGTLSSGGAERVVSNLSMNLPSNIDKEIILFGQNARIEYDYEGRITYLDHEDSTNPLTKISTLIKRLIKLRKIKKRNSNVPIISFLEYPNLLNILSGKNRNSIVSVRNFMSTKHNKGLKALFWNLSIKNLYKKAQKIIVVSKQMKTDLIENYNLPQNKIKVIYNSYPIKHIEKLASEKLIDIERVLFNKPTIITAGRLNRQKGQQHLLNVFKKVKDSIPQAQLVFLGEGGLEKQLKEQAGELMIDDSVHFLGFQQNPFKYISRSKVFVMTSYYEGFPNALAEAMACKVPVISTDCPSGPREILAPNELDEVIDYKNNEQRYGFLIPGFNNENKSQVENIIADLVINLVNNDEKCNYYAEKSYERIKDFDINKVINKWVSVIRTQE